MAESARVQVDSSQPEAIGLSASIVPPVPSPTVATDDEAWRTKIANLQQEFNSQRARMKEIVLQKEANCRQLQTQLDEAHSRLAVEAMSREDADRKAQEELGSLQQLVLATIEESGDAKLEIERLEAETERMRAEIGRMAEVLSHSQQQESFGSTNSLAPVLSHVKKTIARKLGADTTATSSASASATAGDLEDSMRKAQEDAEVLRSLVVPLEEEIAALKEKLRTTDEELQTANRAQSSSGAAPQTVESALVGLLERTAPPKPDTTTEAGDEVGSSGIAAAAAAPSPSPVPCAACSEHSTELASIQTALDSARKEAEHFRTELEREAALRRDLEAQWQEKRDQHKHEVHSLDERVASSEREFNALRQFYGEAKEEMRRQFARLSAEREQTARHLEQLQQDNDFLAGRFAATAAELQNERIDLPCNVEDLQVCLLRAHEDLIETKVGYELEQRRSRTYADEARLFAEKHAELEREMEARLKTLKSRISHLEAERAKLHVLKDTLQQREIEFERQATELRVQEIELRASNEKLQQQNAEWRQKSVVLQGELANTETVQQDFVRLSQSLQMELEKIRAADSTVRWQDGEDVDECPACRTGFAVTRRQVNCRHCGTIYCEKCLTKTVLSGQRRKPARVCDVCHTLLERNTAPYFSQAPPQSPT